MARKNDYFVIETTDLGDLATQVVEWLDKGCALVGGVSNSYNPDNRKMYYAQALIDNAYQPSPLEAGEI